MKIHNFSPGPSILPHQVIKKASDSILNFQNTGLSLIEMSHRDKRVIAVMEKAQSLVLQLLNLDDKKYKVLFLQGGASLQFPMVAHNLLENQAAYLDTGSWASKSIKEAKMLGNIEVIASSKDKNYNYIPKNYTVPSNADYLHITTNNTIFGTQIKDLPVTDVPIVSDMSSDIFSCQRDFSKFSLIYAGAQKNMGPAGVTLVVVREDILGKFSRTIPSILDYKIHINAGSMYNTPPVFALYTSMLTLEWVHNMGGIKVIEKINQDKAKLIYDELDRNPLFIPFAEKQDRSFMNITFNLSDQNHKELFDNLCKESNIYNLTGHRSVGGYRASIYNALPKESVEVLLEVMQKFKKIV